MKRANKNKLSLNYVVRVIIILLLLFLFLFIVLCITAVIWIPIILYFKYSIKIALLGFLITVFLNTLFADFIIVLLHKKYGNEKATLNQMIINDWLIVISLLFFTLLIIFDFNLNLMQNTLAIIESQIRLPLLWGSLFPILMLADIATNIFIIILKILHRFNKDIKFKLIDLLIILTTSTFFGIIFMNNIDVSVLSDVETAKLYRNIDTIQIVMTAFLVPLIIKKIFSKNKSISVTEVNND